MIHQTFDNPEWLQSDAIVKGKLGPVPLIKFQEFIGYDETTRPSAPGRVEQLLALGSICRFFLLSSPKQVLSFFLWAQFTWTRKGVDAHLKVITGYMEGMDMKAEDRFIICDVIPNRCGVPQSEAYSFMV